MRNAIPRKYMRLTWDDGAPVQVGFTSKGAAKSAVAVAHQKLPDRSAADAMKRVWSEHFDDSVNFSLGCPWGAGTQPAPHFSRRYYFFAGAFPASTGKRSNFPVLSIKKTHSEALSQLVVCR